MFKLETQLLFLPHCDWVTAWLHLLISVSCGRLGFVSLKVNEEQLLEPVKTSDAFSEHLSSLNVTSEPPEGVAAFIL